MTGEIDPDAVGAGDQGGAAAHEIVVEFQIGENCCPAQVIGGP